MLDYEVDSDDEWEEEDPGESISNSEVSQERRDINSRVSLIIVQSTFVSAYTCVWV